MNRIKAAIATVVLIGAGIGAYAQTVELSPLLSTMNADNATFYPRLTYNAGGFGPMGVIYGTSATTATAGGTAEQTLATYSLPANALDKAGRRILVHAAFHCATNSNNKTMKLYFGGSVITTPTAASSNVNAVLDLVVVKSGSSTQIVSGTGIVATTAVTPYVNAAGSDTDTAAIVIKATGTDGTDSAGDITLDDFQVIYAS